jgi:hypothetical protein
VPLVWIGRGVLLLVVAALGYAAWRLFGG